MTKESDPHLVPKDMRPGETWRHYFQRSNREYREKQALKKVESTWGRKLLTGAGYLAVSLYVAFIFLAIIAYSVK